MQIYNWIRKFASTETFSYLFFGVLTSLVNYSIFIYGLSLTNQKNVLYVNLVAFAGATLFAYLTNKIFVFHSGVWKLKQILVELTKFVGARIFSLFVEQIGLYIAMDVFYIERYNVCSVNGLVITKVALSFLAVLLNYFASKFVVFKKEK